MRAIAVVNQKGGCGKTTTAINLAAFLARAGRRTLVVDMDPQGHATLGLVRKADELPATIYDVFAARFDGREASLRDVTLRRERAPRPRAVERPPERRPGTLLVGLGPRTPARGVRRRRARALRLPDRRLPARRGHADLQRAARLHGSHRPDRAGVLLPARRRQAARDPRHPGPGRQSRDHAARADDVLLRSHAVRARGQGGDSAPPRREVLPDGHPPQREAGRGGQSRRPDRRVPAGTAWASTTTRSSAPRCWKPRSGRCLPGSRTRGSSSRSTRRARTGCSWPGTSTAGRPKAARCSRWGRHWKSVLKLDPGRYRYRYVVDGEWRSDPLNAEVEPAPFGGFNSVVVVQQRPEDGRGLDGGAIGG